MSSNVGYRKRKGDALAVPAKKARIGGQVPMLRPRIVRPLDAPKAGDRTFTLSRLVHTTDTLVCSEAVGDATGYQGQGSLLFSLNRLPNYAAWTACFDEYRILKCEVEFQPRWNTTGSAGTAVNHHIIGWFPIDSANAQLAAGGSEAQFINKVGYRQFPFNDKSVKTTVYPSPELGAINLTNTNPVIGEPSTWLSTTTPTTPHYGLMYRIYSPQATSNDTLVAGEIYVRYTIQFRQAK